MPPAMRHNMVCVIGGNCKIARPEKQHACHFSEDHVRIESDFNSTTNSLATQTIFKQDFSEIRNGQTNFNQLTRPN